MRKEQKKLMNELKSKEECALQKHKELSHKYGR